MMDNRLSCPARAGQGAAELLQFSKSLSFAYYCKTQFSIESFLSRMQIRENTRVIDFDSEKNDIRDSGLDFSNFMFTKYISIH